MRRALRETLFTEPGVRIVGEAASPSRALRLAERLQPDVVLLDTEMEDLDANKVIRAFRQRVPNSTVIVVTIEPDRLGPLAQDIGSVVAIGKVDGPVALLRALRGAARRPSGPS